MSQEKQEGSKRRVEQLIFKDELTEVFNRRYLFHYLPQEIQRVKNQRENLWLFMIDADDFKTVNDKYGHLSGDMVLKSLADILQKCVRENDTVIRYAGDEFTVILPSGKIGDALSVADRIIKTASGYKFATQGGQSLGKVNVSIGIANFPDDAKDPIRLIDLADKALYASKESGKNCISLVGDVSTDILRGREILERFPCPKLIERDNQWQQIIDAFTNVSEGKSVELIGITGQAGTGKTRLLDMVAEHIQSEAKTLLMGKCTEKYTTQPYSSLLNSMNQYLRSLSSADKEILSNLSETQLGILSMGLPVLQEIFGIRAQGGDLSDEEKEKEFAQGLVGLLTNIASGGSLCILFDDFQYIDEKTLQVLNTTVENISSMMLCCAFSKAEFLSSEELEYPLFHMQDSLVSRFVTIELEDLSSDGVLEMINAILGIESPEELTRLIYSKGHGNPLFVEEVLKFLIQKGFLYYHKGIWGTVEIAGSDIPDSLEGVIRERINSLDKNAREIISKAAVIGKDFNLDLLHRMGKEDEGYIVDILESAKRAGLIKETNTQYGEELSFISEEIRKVLYGLMEQDKTRSLHQQLGEIKEGLHSDNLDTIAGELFYHFKKADDYHRATQYANRIKEAKGLFFDRAVKYAKEILEDVEEKKEVIPLSKKSLGFIPGIIRCIYLLNLNIALYPPRSESIVKPLDEMFDRLAAIFVRDEVVMFSEVKGTLIVNGEKPKGISLTKAFEESFLSFLRSHAIESLSLKRGLTKSEFFTFLEVANNAEEDQSASDLVRAKQLFHIEVNDVTYELVEKEKKSKDRKKLEEVMLMDFLFEKIGVDSGKNIDLSTQLETHAQEIADAITKIGEEAAKEGQGQNVKQADVVAKSVQKIVSQVFNKDPKDWNKHKKGIAKTITNLEPSLRKDVLLSDKILMPIIAKKDVMQDLVSEIPDEVIADLLIEEFQKEKPAPTKLKCLVRKFIATPERRQRMLSTLKDKFIRKGLPKDEVGWVFGEKNWRDLSFEEKISRFLEMTAFDYLNLESDIKIKTLITEIIHQDRYDLIIKVLTKWMDFLSVEATETRIQIANATQDIMSAIPSFKYDVLSTLVGLICNHIDKESDSKVFFSLLNLITQRAISFITRKDFKPAKIIIQGINRISASGKSAEHQKILRESKEKIVQLQRLKSIVGELIKRVDENSDYTDIIELISDIGDPIVDALIQEAMMEDKLLSSLGYFGVFLRRRAIGAILLQLMQKTDRNMIIDRLKVRLSDPQWHIVKNTIELFMYIQDPRLAEHLEPVLDHQDSNIKIKLMFALGRLGGGESVRLLLKALHSKDKTIRLHAIRVLGKIGDKSVIKYLNNYAQNSDIKLEVQNAIKRIEKRALNNQNKE